MEKGLRDTGSDSDNVGKDEQLLGKSEWQCEECKGECVRSEILNSGLTPSQEEGQCEGHGHNGICPL